MSYRSKPLARSPHAGPRCLLVGATGILLGMLAAGTIAGCSTAEDGNGSGAGGQSAGSSGSPGAAGSTGAAGSPGVAGSTGVAGSPGAGGSSGVAGTPGAAGTLGAAGSTGTAGATGAAGAAAGSTGTAGGASAGRGGSAAGSTGTAGGAAAGRGGSTGTGGAAAGTSGKGGGAAGTTGGGGAVGCGSLPFCDTFESGTVGQAPSATNWTVINANGGENSSATIDAMGAHGSSKSVKINGMGSRFWLRSGAIKDLGPEVHVRFWIRFGAAIPNNHSAFFDTHPQVVSIYDDQPALRLGTQDGALHWNTDTDAANLPDVSPQGKTASFAPAANTWYCVELTINKSNGHLDFLRDGQQVAGLVNDGTPTQNIDQGWISSNSAMRYQQMVEFDIGWRDFGSGKMTLWFDDVALSNSPIGCN